MRLYSLPLLLLALAQPVQAGSGGSSSASVAFDVRADGFRLGELTAQYKAAKGMYDVSVQAAAGGLIGFFLQARYTGESNGRLTAKGIPVPDVFTAHSSRIFKNRVQRVDFAKGKPTKVSISPRRDMTPMSDPKLVTDQRIDPLSYLGLFIQDRKSGCPKAADMYDGRRLTHISFIELAAGSNHILCEGFYEIIKGPDHTIQPGRRKFALEFDYKRSKGPLARLQTITVTSGGNKIVMRRLD